MTNPLAVEDTSWGSHLVPLFACITATRGAVLEVGVGHWSTPLLHAYCCSGGRKLVSIDEDMKWTAQFSDLRVAGHEVYSCKYDETLRKLSGQQWSVVFLDQSPGWRRASDALLFRDRADFIVVHDWSGAEVRDPFTDEVLFAWGYWAVAKFSPSTLILGRIPIPDFEKREAV